MSNKDDYEIITTSEAIRDGLLISALADEKVLFFAEGVTDPAAVFGTLSNLSQHINKKRLIEMPIAENGLIGIAIGCAVSGHRPVINLHRVEFALLAMEQIINNAAKIAFMSGGLESVPLVIRMIVGRGWGQGPNHSQSLESIFAHIPGLKVIMPTFPSDAKGMIISAIQDNNPVIVIENRWCHYLKGEVKKGYYQRSIDGPKVIREGTDYTIVASSYMAIEAIMAAKVLEMINIRVEIIDLRVLRPLNTECILASVKKTGRLMTLDLGWVSYGIGAEIIASVITQDDIVFKSRPIRLGVADKPTPSSRGLVSGHYTNSVDIVKNICDSLGLANDISKKAIDTAVNSVENNPIDIPNANFKGPF